MSLSFDSVKCHIVRTDADLQRMLAFIDANDLFGFDIETNGTKWFKGDVVVGFSVATATEGFYLPIFAYNKATGELVRCWDEEAVQLVLNRLNNKKLLAWNGAFEALFCRHNLQWEFLVAFWADVMLMLHTCDENRFNYGLKENSEAEYGEVAVLSQHRMLASMEANGGADYEYYKADTEPLGVYCIWDSALTVMHYQRLLPALVADGLEAFFFTDEVMPLYIHVTVAMEEKGIRLDLPMVKQALKEINVDLAAIESRIQSAIKPYLAKFEAWYLNKNWPPARTGNFAQAICEYAGLELPRTPAGKYSLTADNIAALSPSRWSAILQQKAYMTPSEVLEIQQKLWSSEGQQYMFNLSSKDHLKRLFFESLDEKPLGRTPTGKPQVDDDFLDVMAKKYKWAEELRIYNKLIKIRGTYIERFLDHAEGDIFYPQWKQHGTVTGRFSGDLQQLPRLLDEDDEQIEPVVLKYTNRIRNFFIAHEGAVLIDADYESLEPHVFAHISRDPAIIEIFKKGWDFYSTGAIRAEKLEGFSADKKADNFLGKLNKAKRQGAKKYMLGIAYGEEDYKLAFELGFIPSDIDLYPKEEKKRLIEAGQAKARPIVEGYWKGFPVLYQTSEAGKKHILQNGYIGTEFGRRRRLPEARWIVGKYGLKILNSLELWKEYNHIPAIYEDVKKLRKRLKKALNAAINFPTQGGSASIVNRSAIALARAYKEAGLPAVIIANIHDELLVSCESGYEQVAAKIMQKCMESTVTLSVNLKAEPVIGTRYGEIK